MALHGGGRDPGSGAMTGEASMAGVPLGALLTQAEGLTASLAASVESLESQLTLHGTHRDLGSGSLGDAGAIGAASIQSEVETLLATGLEQSGHLAQRLQVQLEDNSASLEPLAAQFVATGEDVRGKLAERREAAQDFTEQQETDREELRTRLEACQTATGSHRDQLLDTYDSTTEDVESTSSQIEDDHVPNLTGGFNDLLSYVADTASQGVESQFSDLRERLHSEFDRLERHATAEAGVLTQGVVSALIGSADRLTSDALTRVESGIQHVIEHGVRALATEIAEQTVVATTGAATTAALTPLIPELLALKVAAKAVNFFADLFGIG